MTNGRPVNPEYKPFLDQTLSRLVEKKPKM